jgi:phosphatidylglycerol:prolipoprotein diacylglycerol transferase
MHPVLVNIFSFPIHSYGVMLALSFLFGIILAGYRAKKLHLNPDLIPDIAFWVIIAAIVGARLYYVFLHFEEFQGNLFSIINPFQGNKVVGIGGLVMYGGFIGAILSGIIYFKVKKLSFLPYADAMAPSVGLGIMLTRFGCFLNGCCYGAPHTGASAVRFPLESPAGDYQAHVHAASLYPSQIFESVGGLVIALTILAFGTRKPFVGFHFYLLGLMYSVLRFIVDYSRYYSESEKLGSLSHNQVVCIVLFVLFSGLILKGILFKDDNKKNTPENNPSDQDAVATASTTPN